MQHNTHWYDILVQEKYVDYFSRSSQAYFRVENGLKIYEPLFEEFRSIVFGLTTACMIGAHVPEGYVPALADRNLYEYLGYRFFLDVCPNGYQRFSKVWRSMDTHHDSNPAGLSSEQLAVLILHPFWSRMDGSFEDEFARSGELGRYLRILQQKAWDESEDINHGPSSQ